MIAAPELIPPESAAAWAGTYRFSGGQFNELLACGVLADDEPVEFLDGYVVTQTDRETTAEEWLFPQWSRLHRWSLADYTRMVELGLLTPADKLELIDGHLVLKMPQNVPHRAAVARLAAFLPRYLPVGWWLQTQCPLVVGEDVPEPDGSVLRGAVADYDRRHPTAADCGLVIEVADSSLRDDRRVKGAVYAHAGIPTYWIVNVADRRIEVLTNPSGPLPQSGYAQRTDHGPGEAVPLILDGSPLAPVPVADLLP